MKKALIFILSAALLSTSCGQKEKAGSESQQPSTTNQAAGQPSSEAGDVLLNSPQQPIPPEKMLNPLDSIKELDKKIESYKTGPNLTAADLEKNRRLKQEIIRGTFDLYELSRMALGVHWDSLNDQQKSYFVDLMTRLLERKAIFSKEQVKGESKPYLVSYVGEKPLDAENSKSKVTTKINVPSEKVTLAINYELTKTPYGWKIYDVIVDEASLVENYKFQFDTIIRKYGYDDLIQRMEKKLKQME